jgi:hypothetical protein
MLLYWSEAVEFWYGSPESWSVIGSKQETEIKCGSSKCGTEVAMACLKCLHHVCANPVLDLVHLSYSINLIDNALATAYCAWLGDERAAMWCCWEFR